MVSIGSEINVNGFAVLSNGQSEIWEINSAALKQRAATLSAIVVKRKNG